MARLVLFGATGYAGTRIREEALRRGHEVVAVARDTTALAGGPGVTVRQGSLHDEAFVRETAVGADVLVCAIPGRPLDGATLLDAVPVLVAAAAAQDARLGVVGGAGSLRTSADGPKLIDTPEFPEAFKLEAGSHSEVLDALRANGSAADWFYLSPAAGFGAHTPGRRRGTYRVGGEVLLSDEEGVSAIGGEDFATAFVDEIERPAHHRQRFTVAY
ncbi:NAD-dependent epimerase [Amycolatopsis antarctica]|uniref:NAD-dependent epimerase n=1 Tax=Amycolatopsis antarctica TaxID=1854586 RepID=A0A263D4W1_9PSEU|nr:NAD(P)H-binding protein [Amycolatopsis antarctica]OZM73532.1 NAD-dependent epimerase [Amycolatopsis antarctica]